MPGPLYADNVTRLRAPFVTDRYGNPSTERDWSQAVSLALSGVSVQPVSSAEAAGDRQTVVTGWVLRTERGVDADVLPGDRIQSGGRMFDVDGDIGRYTRGGSVHHVEVALKEVSG